MKTRPTKFLAAVLALHAIGAAAPIAAFALDESLVVPAVGRGAGAQDSQWYTSFWVSNPGTEACEVTLRLLERNRPNPSPEELVMTVPSGATLRWSDVIWDLFGRDAAAGALQVSSTAPVVAGARVFNQPGDDVRESQGQLMSGLPVTRAISVGESSTIAGVLQPPDGTFRTNFGLVETAGGTAVVSVTLRDGAGVQIASDQLTLGPSEVLQRPLDVLDGSASLEVGRLDVDVVSGDGAVIAYGSAVANGIHSQDPTTLEMSALSDSTVSDEAVHEVVAGPGLSGGGIGPMVTIAAAGGDGIDVGPDGISIASGGVQAEHIADEEVVKGVAVDGTVLHDVVGIEAGDGLEITASAGVVTVSTAQSGEGEFTRIEVPLGSSLVASSAGVWVLGDDVLELPSDGVWRVGFRVVARVQNFGFGLVADPVTVALVDADSGAVVRGSLTVSGTQVAIGAVNSAVRTLSGEAVVDVHGPTHLVIAGRTSSGSLQLSLLAHDVDLGPGLGAPDAASFLFAEKVGP